MKRFLKLHVFQDGTVGPAKQRWRWNLMSSNGKLICTSGEPFFNRSNAVRAADRFLDMLGVGCNAVYDYQATDEKTGASGRSVANAMRKARK